MPSSITCSVELESLQSTAFGSLWYAVDQSAHDVLI